MRPSDRRGMAKLSPTHTGLVLRTHARPWASAGAEARAGAVAGTGWGQGHGCVRCWRLGLRLWL